MIKILITGGAGYIGSVLTGQLLKKKYHVTIYDNLTYGGEHLIHFFSFKNFEFIKGDIRDETNLKRALKNKDIIIHLAAIVGYPACSRNPKLAKEINLPELCITSKAVAKIFDEEKKNFFEIENIPGINVLLKKAPPQ